MLSRRQLRRHISFKTKTMNVAITVPCRIACSQIKGDYQSKAYYSDFEVHFKEMDEKRKKDKTLKDNGVSKDGKFLCFLARKKSSETGIPYNDIQWCLGSAEFNEFKMEAFCGKKSLTDAEKLLMIIHDDQPFAQKEAA